MKTLYACLFIFLFMFQLRYPAQCTLSFSEDTLTLPESGRQVTAQTAEVTLRNKGSVTLYRTGQKMYMRLLMTENFYFNKTGTLEIRSRSKSYYVKNTKQFKIDKTKARFTIEIYKNYLETLMEYGITSIVFAGAETRFGKHDVRQVKELAGCMLASLAGKN